ncbi:SDR family NAD(P)-dependent oxidoreductase [Streptomyces sp. T028]|uniref:SDR family NAD(P)-dependent oxidoreductase n=1 Tax=Streptomyces sp. T028 TaxID=3394379 RepID=UPI003A84C42B
MTTIVMTGATAGLGAQAVRHLVARNDTRVLAGARGIDRVAPEGVELLPLDLESLDSVRAFADDVRHRTEAAGIDILVLNAGGQFPNSHPRTPDGYEPTFAVNHLAHYLLARLLLPAMADNGRLVITTSDTHDPAITPIGPKTLDPERLAHPPKGGGVRAYPASKLCNLLTARSLAVQDEAQARHLTVIAYNPGLTGGTSLGRSQPWVARKLMPLLLPPIAAVLSRFRPQYHLGTPERAGEALAELALGRVSPPSDRVYASLVRGELTFPDPSELARDDRVRDLLWRESAAMVGLTV